MGKKVIKFLSLFISSVLLLVVTSGVFAVDEYDLKLNVKFDKNSYFPGETAVATVYITDAADEKDMMIAGFGTNLSYEGMTFNKELSSLNSKIEITNPNDVNIIESNAITKGDVTKDLIALGFVKDGGFLINHLSEEEITDESEIEIFKLIFTVENGASEISIGFEDESISGSFNYLTEIFKPSTTVKDAKYKCKIQQTDSTAEYVASGFASTNAYYNTQEHPNYVSVMPCIHTENGGTLIAKLINKETGLPVAIGFDSFTQLGKHQFLNDDLLLNINGVAFDKLEIKYYLWDSITGMKPLLADGVDGNLIDSTSN